METPFESQLSRHQDRRVEIRAEVEPLGRKRQRIRVTFTQPFEESYEFTCDEPSTTGGEGTAPPPLAYFVAGLASCLTGKVPQYGKVFKEPFDVVGSDLSLVFHTQGSALRGDLTTKVETLDVEFSLNGDATDEGIERVVATARRACHALQAIEQPATGAIRWRRSAE